MPTRLDFDEIRALAGAIYAETENESEEVRKKRLCDWFEEMLIDAYIAGLTSTGLPIDPIMEPEAAQSIINRKIDGKTYRDRLIEHIENGDAGRIENLAESESHRVSEAGAYQAAKQCQDALNVKPWPNTGTDASIPQKGPQRGRKSTVEKVWTTMEDERVRTTHYFLDGVGVPLSTLFFTIDGDSARYPGDFTKADNNVNCRCWLEYRIW